MIKLYILLKKSQNEQKKNLKNFIFRILAKSLRRPFQYVVFVTFNPTSAYILLKRQPQGSIFMVAMVINASVS